MTIEKINSLLSATVKINRLNAMVLELNGLIEQGKFDKNELDNIYQLLALCKKYKRGVTLGNTLATYTNWSHVHAESGYSIWKFSPSGYSANDLNRVYFDDTVLENMGTANSETATTFDSVFLYNGSTYVNNTTEAGTENGTAFALMTDTNDYLYLGAAATFTGIKLELETPGSQYTLAFEYWNGSAWVALTVTDNTSNFESDGLVEFAAPSNWATTTVNSVTKYWVRVSTTTAPITTAEAYYAIPGNSVIGLLAMSSTQVINEAWRFCSYGTALYVTIRNAGNASYEGNYYVTSSSSAANKQNFFISNHTYKADYLDSAYSPVAVKTADYSATINDAIIVTDSDVYLPSAVEMKGKQLVIKRVGGSAISVVALTGEYIDGSASYTLSNNYDAITVVADGTSKWYIISK